MRSALCTSFHALNITQFLVVFNDNIFKFLIVYLLIDLYGEDSASSILAFSGVVFVLPFLLFSFFAGSLADSIGKLTMIILTKAVEIGIAILGVLFLFYQNAFGLWFTLFLYAVQSTFFSPAKLGIMAEIVKKDELVRANGQMSASMYIAVILGSLSASLLLDATDRNYVFTGSICVFTAIFGLITALKIKQYKEHKSPILSFKSFIETVEWFGKTKYAKTAIIGDTFFLLMGSFVQLNLIPFAMRSLGLSDIAGGYLFFLLAVGVSLGAYACASIPSKKPKISFTPLAGVAIAFFFFLLDLFSDNLEAVCLLLLFLGFSGGFFQVPLNSFLQSASPDHLRSKIMGIDNFFAFTGIFLSSLLLYFLQTLLEIPPDTCFTFLGVISLGISFYLHASFKNAIA